MSIESNIGNMDEDEAKDMLSSIIEYDYRLVEWPESQRFMDKSWFKKEASLADSSFGNAAYFIPLKRIME